MWIKNSRETRVFSLILALLIISSSLFEPLFFSLAFYLDQAQIESPR